MSAVVNAVSNAFESVGRAVSKVGQFAGKMIEGTVKSIGANPLKFLATAVAIGTGNAWAIPIINGVAAVASGQPIGQALLTTAASYAANWVTGGLDLSGAIGGGAIGAAADNVVRGVVTAGLTGGNIGEAALTGAVTGFVGGALRGADLGTQLGVPAVAAGLVSDSLGGAASAALRGRDAAEGAVSGLAGGLFNWGANGVTGTLDDIQSQIGDSNDPNSQELQAQIDQLRGTTDSYSGLANDYATTTQESQDVAARYNDVGTRYNEALQPSVDAYTAAQDTYNAAVDTYQARVSEFNDLQAQYDTAVASGNDELANTLADQANAKITEANSAYAEYQAQQGALDTAYTDYTTARDSSNNLFEEASTLKDQYEASQLRLQELDTQGQAAQAAFQEQQAAVEAQYNTYVDASARQAFASLDDEDTSGGAIETYGDDSTVQSFGDDSRRVTDASGVTTYDSEGNAYDEEGNPIVEEPAVDEAGAPPAASSAARNYAAALKGLFAGSGRQSNARTRSNAAAGRPVGGAPPAGRPVSGGAPGAPGAPRVDPSTGLPIAIGAGAAVSNLLGGNRPDTEPVFGGGTDTNYDVMAPVSRIQQQGAANVYNIPGITDLINPGSGQGGYTQAAQNVPGQPQTTKKNMPINTADIYDEELQPAPEEEESLYGASGGAVTSFFAQGGQPQAPMFFSEGGANYVNTGSGTHGTEDGVDAKLAEGEFVVPADVVAALGNGSNEAGAGALQKLVESVRQEKQSSSPDQLPPDAKSPLEYLQQP